LRVTRLRISLRRGTQAEAEDEGGDQHGDRSGEGGIGEQGIARLSDVVDDTLDARPTFLSELLVHEPLGRGRRPEPAPRNRQRPALRAAPPRPAVFGPEQFLEGPILFVQERMGRNNTTYRCYKFRSMYVDQLDGKGVASTARGDCRITRVGRFLRLTSIDELPQLFNVLAGDMSLVGPRPHALGSRAEGSLFWDLVPDYWSRHSMKPGVTGLAQVRGLRGATHSREDIEHRVAADLEYINGWSLWLDIKILAKTPLVVIHRNAY